MAAVRLGPEHDPKRLKKSGAQMVWVLTALGIFADSRGFSFPQKEGVMFGWIKRLLIVPPPPALQEKVKQRTELDQYELEIQNAQSAVSLPSDYFLGLNGKMDCPFRDVRLDTVKRSVFSQSPLHCVMAGGHDHYPESFRERLWSDERYRQAVAHVLHNIPSAQQMLRACDSIINTGYNGPMIAVLRRAAKEGLVGLNRTLSVDGWVYS